MSKAQYEQEIARLKARINDLKKCGNTAADRSVEGRILELRAEIRWARSALREERYESEEVVPVDTSGEPVAGFAVQAGSALESNLAEPLQPELVDLASESAQTAVTPQIEFQDFWPWLAGLALVAVVAEGWLAWRR